MKKRLLTLLLMSGVIVAGSFSWNSDLIFSHKLHVVDEGLECIDCHESAVSSTSAMDDLLVAEATCRDCHEESETSCNMCHIDADNPVAARRINDYISKFNHELHTRQEGMTCLACHQGVDKSESGMDAHHLPSMDDCMSCHTTPAELSGCYSCHDQDESLRPLDHAVAWSEMHGMAAASGAQSCNSCHRENYCIDCHLGENIAGFSHDADFMITHAQKFMTRESDCAACHQSRDFCIECHVNVNMIEPANHFSPEWGGMEHAVEARIDFERCAVCHQSADVTCMECHN